MSRNTIGRIVALPVMLSLVATPALAEKADQLTTLPFQVQGSYADPQVRLRLIKKIVP